MFGKYEEKLATEGLDLTKKRFEFSCLDNTKP